MAVTIITTRNQGFPWHRRDALQVKGYLFDSAGTCRRGAAMLDYFAVVTDADRFRDCLRAANGAFAVLLETSQRVFAAVDAVRSLPFFYAMNGPDLVLGDDARAIQRELGGEGTDAIAQEEFLRAGYTVGPNTLDPRIKQIEAGELLVYDKSTGQSRSLIYFSHAHGDYTSKHEASLLDELEQVYTRLTQRLIESVQGRTIVVPLSGGYDSRSVVCSLKCAGYSKVVYYSYGVPASFEHQIASKVAAELGYPLHILDYSLSHWQAMLESPRFSEFCRFSSQLCVVPCIQDLLAMEMLTRQELIPPDSVIVPGYGADTLGGDFIPYPVRDGKPDLVLAEGIDPYLLRTQFEFRTSPLAPETAQVLCSRINAFTSRFQSDDIESFCSVMEDWIIRNREAKFIINTVRTHELFNHEWRLPLWDNELTGWWHKIPVRFRTNRVLYNRFLFERLFEPMHLSFKKPARANLTHSAQRLLPAAVIPILRGIYKKTFARFRPDPVDLNNFDVISGYILERLPRSWSVRDFSHVNAGVGAWCLVHHL